MIHPRHLKLFLQAHEALERAAAVARQESRSLGEKLRVLRREAGISLREQARRLGITAGYLSDLERGNRRWSKRMVEKL